MRSTKKQIKEDKDGYLVQKNGRRYGKEYYEKFKKYQVQYAAKNYRQYNFRLNYNKHQDVIEYFDSLDNLTGYVIDLVRADLEKQK